MIKVDKFRHRFWFFTMLLFMESSLFLMTVAAHTHRILYRPFWRSLMLSLFTTQTQRSSDGFCFPKKTLGSNVISSCFGSCYWSAISFNVFTCFYSGSANLLLLVSQWCPPFFNNRSPMTWLASCYYCKTLRYSVGHVYTLKRNTLMVGPWPTPEEATCDASKSFDEHYHTKRSQESPFTLPETWDINLGFLSSKRFAHQTQQNLQKPTTSNNQGRNNIPKTKQTELLGCQQLDFKAGVSPAPACSTPSRQSGCPRRQPSWHNISHPLLVSLFHLWPNASNHEKIPRNPWTTPENH